MLFPFLFLFPTVWASSLPARDLVLPLGNATTATGLESNSITKRCDHYSAPPVEWHSCYNAWLQMFDTFDERRTEKLHFQGRHVRPQPPASVITTPIRWLSDDGACAVDLLMSAERIPRGQIDRGDDTYGFAIIEAARYILDDCAKPLSRGGTSSRFTNTNRLSIHISSFEPRMQYVQCLEPPPHAPITDDVKDKVVRALSSIPTNEKATTFNHTRVDGPAGTKVVTYLLPRTEPAHEPPPVLRVDMTGDVVTSGSWWDIWTAGIGVYTKCIQHGKAGFSWHIGTHYKLTILLGLG